jgi:hypothetical protein
MPKKQQKEYGPQSCLFCGKHDKEMPVYSVGLGRLGICFDCAQKAVKELWNHKLKKEAEKPQYKPRSLFEIGND